MIFQCVGQAVYLDREIARSLYVWMTFVGMVVVMKERSTYW